MTTKAFHTAEVGLFLPGGTTTTLEDMIGAAPIGALSIYADPLETTGVLAVSDDGYRTKASDPGGVAVYAQLIDGPFEIDRAMSLSPAQGATAWGYGSLSLHDDGAMSALMRAWNIDAQDITIKRGVKTREDFQAQRSGRTTSGWVHNYANVLTEIAAGALRWDYSTGTPVLLDEAAATNSVANPRAEGASAGTPGTAPTGWSVTTTTSGITRSIVGTGTEDGVPYVDVRFQGTASASGLFQIAFVSTTAVAATVAQNWTASAYVKLQAGSTSGVAAIALRIGERGGSTSPDTIATFTPTTAALGTQRRSVSRTFSVSDTTNAFPRATVSINSGSTADITLRVGAPQMEMAAAATSVILPAVGVPAVTTRAADRLYSARGIWTSPAAATRTTLFRGLAGRWRAEEGKVIIPIRDASYWLERPLQTSVYAGSGTHEGTASMAGTPKPLLRGTAYNIKPDLIDPTNRVYRYNDAAGTILALYERGVTGITFASDTSNLWAGSTPAGQYRTDNSKGLFQLGSAPVGEITLDATGQFPTAGNKTVLMDIVRYLLSETAALPSAYLDTSTFGTVAAAYPYAGGVFVPSTAAPSALSIVSDLLASMGARLYPTRAGALTVSILATIGASETVAAVLTPSAIRRIAPLQLEDEIETPPWRIRVGYQRNHTIQTDLSASATDARRQTVAAEAQYKVWSDTSVLASYRRASDLAPFGGALKDAADAQSVADRLGALFGRRRTLSAVELPISVGINLDLGNVVHVTYPADPFRDGAKGRIMREMFRSGDSITFAVFA